MEEFTKNTDQIQAEQKDQKMNKMPKKLSKQTENKEITFLAYK